MLINGRPSKERSVTVRLGVIGLGIDVAHPYVLSEAGHGVNVDAFALPVSVYKSEKSVRFQSGFRIFGFGLDFSLWAFWDKPHFAIDRR
jgi:hypothetical protein